MTTAIRQIVFLAYQHHQPLDLVGPLQVFALANRESAAPEYDILVAALHPGRLETASGPSLMVDHGLDTLAAADTIVLPGGPGVAAAADNAELIAALRAAIPSVRRICSVCTGAFLLAPTGMLNGRKATTHWRSCAQLADQFRDIKVQPDSIYVNDGPVWTSAGVTAGIDMALALVEQDLGRDLAGRIARNLIVYLRRPGGQSQFSEPLALQGQSASGRYSKLLERVAVELEHPWSIEDLARAAGQSERTFQRRFTEITGQSPSATVEIIRVEQARIMLETTTVPQSAIARRAGFASIEHMRRAFHRRLGMAPGAIRELFGRTV